jgi:hypothetical protein
MHSVEHDRTLERKITIFVRESETYRRVDEHHVLRLYPEADVVTALEEAGFQIEVRGGYADPAPFPGWRVFVAMRLSGAVSAPERRIGRFSGLRSGGRGRS